MKKKKGVVNIFDANGHPTEAGKRFFTRVLRGLTGDDTIEFPEFPEEDRYVPTTEEERRKQGQELPEMYLKALLLADKGED